jgi:cAMP phosphodiesterase
LGTLEGLADIVEDAFWDEPLAIFITHGHIDHHAELMILSEIYCRRRGVDIYDIRPPLPVYCTAETQHHLFNTHRYGFNDGATLRHKLIVPGSTLRLDSFEITPLAVDHFEGAVIYVIQFGFEKKHKIVIGWDMTTLPMAADQLKWLYSPSLALVEATTWEAMAVATGHTSIEELVATGFLDRLGLQFDPTQEKYGAYLVHYSGREDAQGMLTDQQLKQKFDRLYPHLSNVVRVAERGQQFCFNLNP